MVQDASPQKLHQRAFGRFLVLVVILFCVLAARLWHLQIIKGWQLTERSEANRIRAYRINGPRGMIYDRHGEMLVDNRPSFNLNFNPAAISEKERLPFLAAVCSQLDCDVETAQARLGRRVGAITLKEELTRDELARVEAMQMFYEGKEFPLAIEQVGKRIFKQGPLFAHVIGYTGEIDQDRLNQPEYAGYQPGDRVGRAGVEATYEQQLRGEFGLHKIEENARGMRIRSLAYTPASPGKNLTLNIDLTLQQTAANVLAGRAGSIVALDPRDGRVLALYSSPTFDPELFTRPLDKDEWEALSNNPRHPLQNKAIAGQYPPGSTFKVVAALGGLADAVITEQTPLSCEGKWKFGERDWRCANERGHGAIAFMAAIEHSCDIYFYKLGNKMGIERLAKWGRMMGAGRKTGIDIPGEQDGLMPDPAWKQRVHHKDWLPGETLNAAIGQGSVMLTPLQLATIYAAIANGGTVYKPQVVGQITGHDGAVVRPFTPVVAGRIEARPELLRDLRRALTNVVNSPGGTAFKVRLKSLLVAGKTGTAQVRKMGKVRQSGGPYEQRDHSWFVCFAPADKPEITVAALIEHGGFGAQAAAPAAMQVVAKFAQLRYKSNAALKEAESLKGDEGENAE